MSFGRAADHHHDHAAGRDHQAGSRSAVAARTQRTASVIGWIDGVPVPRGVLDGRIKALRSGPLAGRLPSPGTKEDRQFVRWTAHVLLTEELCRVEARRLGLEADRPGQALTQVEALHFGSINAAAWAECWELEALMLAVTSGSETPEVAEAPSREWWRVRHARAATSAAAAVADLRPLGWTTLDDLPTQLAAAIRQAPVGTRVGPLESPLGWHVAVATETAVRPPDHVVSAGDGERFRQFVRWLDERRRRLLTLAEGFEHPGDPAQPDNTHRH